MENEVYGPLYAVLLPDLLAQTRHEHGEDIAAAMAWLERAAKDHPPIGELMEQVK